MGVSADAENPAVNEFYQPHGSTACGNSPKTLYLPLGAVG